MTKSDKQLIEKTLAKTFKKESFVYGRQGITFYSSNPPKYDGKKVIPLSEVIAYCRANSKPYTAYNYYRNVVKNPKTWEDIYQIDIIF